MFNTDEFQNCLQTDWLGENFIYRREVDSTNTTLKKLPEEEFSHGMVLIADSQRKGRGQYEKPWVSAPGENLTFTIGLEPGEWDRLPLLTLSAGKGVIDALEEQFGDYFMLKWPNDLVLKGKKVGGILTESLFNGSKLDRILIGIGLNVNQKSFGKSLQEAVSLVSVFQKSFSRERLLCGLLNHIEPAFRKWENRDKAWISEINQKLAGFGSWVGIEVNGERWSERVKFLGINEMGYLVILTEEMSIKIFRYEQIRIFPDH